MPSRANAYMCTPFIEISFENDDEYSTFWAIFGGFDHNGSAVSSKQAKEIFDPFGRCNLLSKMGVELAVKAMVLAD